MTVHDLPDSGLSDVEFQSYRGQRKPGLAELVDLVDLCVGQFRVRVTFTDAPVVVIQRDGLHTIFLKLDMALMLSQPRGFMDTTA